MQPQTRQPTAQDLNSAMDQIRAFAYRGREAPPRRPIPSVPLVPPTPAFSLDQSQQPSFVAYSAAMNTPEQPYGNARTPMPGQHRLLSSSGAPPTTPKSALKSSSSAVSNGYAADGVLSPGNTDSMNSREMFVQIVSILRARYGDPTPASPLADLTDEDLEDLTAHFHKELRKVCGRNSVTVNDPRAPQTAATPAAAVARSTSTVSSASLHRDAVASSPTATNAAASSGNSSAATAVVVPVPRSLKESMVLLREGCFVTKFSNAKGKPSRRYVRVQHRRALIDGEMIPVPHFCWSATQAEEPSGELSLLTLSGVAVGPSPQIKPTPSTKIVGAQKEPIDDKQCLSVIFGDRSVDIALPTVAHCRAWERALTYVIDRNRRQ